MSVTVCLAANTLGYPRGGGHLWAYLNWALGLTSLGCRVIWLEEIGSGADRRETESNLARLRDHLAPYGLAESVALFSESEEVTAAELGCLDLAQAAEADALLNFQHGMAPELVRRFPRSALIDIDPGLLQWWIARGLFQVAPHDAYFTIGENIDGPSSTVPDTGIRWLHSNPPVALGCWEVIRAGASAPVTTVSHWFEDEWMDDGGAPYRNDKRTAFSPFLDLPRQVPCRLELALCLAPDEDADRAMLERSGWTVRHAYDVSSTPDDYRAYVQDSLGEFSCAKPAYVRLGTAWVSDRTACYLASGKPAVVQHTGHSSYLPDAEGLFRFRSVSDAARHLQTMVGDYDHHCEAARSLAEEHFDARRVVGTILEQVLE